MGIQINGQTDTISAGDGSLVVNGAELPVADITNLNSTGIITATSLNVTGVGTFSNGANVLNGSIGVGTDNPLSNIHILNASGSGNLRIASQINPDGLQITARNDTNHVQLYAAGGNSSALRIYATNSSGTATEVSRISDTYGVTGGHVERYFPVLQSYFNVTAGWETAYNQQFNTSTGVMNETGDYVRFVFPTCLNHKKVLSAKLIYHGSGTVGGTVWTVDGLMYRASNAEGYTSDSANFSFNLPGVSNGKVYIQDFTSVFPTLQEGHINSLQLTFTENIGGSTVFIAGIQLLEATNPV